MSKFRFKMHKTFKSLLCIILVISFLISVSFFIFNYAESKRNLEKQIYLSEQTNLEHFKSLTQNAFSQISLINAAFSRLDMNNIDINDNDVFSNFSTFNKQITLCITMYDYIDGVFLKNKLYSIKKGNAIEDISSGEKIGTYKNVDIYLAKNEVNKRSLVFYQASQNQLDNDVLLTVNGRNLGKYLIDNNLPDATKLITDSNGKILISSRNDYIEKGLFDIFGIKKSELSEFCMNTASKKEKYIFSSSKLGDLELYCIGLTNAVTYNNYNKTLHIRSICVAFVLIIFATVFTLFLTYIAYRPLKKVVKTAYDYYPLVLDNGIDEIQAIQDILKSTHQKNNAMQSEIGKSLEELRRQQVLALQSQISPHFIYNVLDSINWLSINLNGCDNIVSDCIQGTQTLFAYSMNYNSLFSTVEEELEVTKSMAIILSSQFNLEINIIEDIPKELMDCKILKLSLEPFFENAIIHGYGNYTLSGDIKISVRVSDSDLIISISDNGIGMDEKELNEFVESINRNTCEDGKHIGMRNVNMRLKILFGDEYTISVKSEKNKGTSFALKMPIVEIK